MDHNYVGSLIDECMANNTLDFLDLDSLASLAKGKWKVFLSNPYVLEKLARLHSLPIPNSFEQLLEYSRAEPGGLLILSAGRGDIRTTEAILRKPLEPNYYSWAMAAAAGKGHTDIVKLILFIEATGNGNNYNGAMASAAYNGHIEIVQLLLDHVQGYDNIDFKGAIDWAERGGHTEIVKLLKPYI